ncbi:MAG: carboxypeptidase regulatory-like domain-containing protein [Gemmatimonadaceae bacterium]
MLKTRLFLTVATALALVTGASARLLAQGITTGAISGTVTDANGAAVEGAQVQVRNPRTGASAGGLTRANGQYYIQGVEPDPGYSLTVRRIGFEPQTQNNVLVSLGQTTRTDFQLKQQSTVLETVTVSAEATPVINPSKTGTGTTVGDSLLRRLPTLNRNFADFVQLVPQVSTSTGGLSGGGVNLRQNAIQIDGAASGDLFGLGTTGQPGAQANAKSIPLDAVKEYQVLLSPFDVRQGNFGGMLINAVTKTGTNEFHGSTYGYTRNESLTRSQPYLAEFKQQQYGFSLGGPIIKNRLFFFVNPEWQKQNTPATGSFLGSPDSVARSADVTTFQDYAKAQGLTNPGSGARVLKQNPLTNVFGRVDAYLPGYTRLVLRHNYAAADNTTFSRSSSTSSSPLFNLTSNSYLFSSKTHSSVAELLTNLPNGIFNELLLNLTTTHDFRTVPVNYPQITVRGFTTTQGANTLAMVAGTEASSQGNSLDQRTFELTENFTVPVASHHVTFGTKNLFYKPINLFGQNSMGSWTFADTTQFRLGNPVSYSVSAPSATDPANGLATFRANMYSFYVQDAWQKSDRLTITAGVRLEKPKFLDTPPENPQVLTAYGRSTAAVPSKRTISPRFSFNWDATGDQRNQLRGGLGLFTGTPPFVYLSNAFGNSGLSGYASLTCGGNAGNQGTNATSTIPPPFNAANIANPPTACAPFTPAGGGAARPGATTAASSNIATIDPNFRFPQYQKITLGYDHRFGNGLVSTVEGLYTKAISNAFYQNLALAGPQGVDRNGRVLYGTLTATGGTATLAPGGRQQVIDVTNVHGDHTYSLTGQLQKTFFDSFQGSVAYTYSQVRDVAATTSSTQGSNYRYQRDWAGNLADRSLTRGKEDMPHRIIATGTWTLKTLTDFSFIYVGNSGAPFDYVYAAGSGSGSGDANADGQSQNDLVYVPKDAHDPNEILFTGYNGVSPGLTAAQAVLDAQAQADAFDRFIDRVPCLSKNRGKLLGRNTCRNPWQNDVDVSVGQNLRAFGQQNLQLRLDVINFLNLLNKRWGWQNFSDQNNTCGPICSATTLLTQSGNVTAGRTQQTIQGIYTFNKAMKPWNADNASSNYRMQLSLRYSF